MKLRRNAFFYFALMVFLLCMLLAMGCVLHRLGEGQEYPYLLKGIWVLGTLGIAMLLLAAGAVGGRLRVREKLDGYPALILELFAPCFELAHLLLGLCELFGAFLLYILSLSLCLVCGFNVILYLASYIVYALAVLVSLVKRFQSHEHRTVKA